MKIDENCVEHVKAFLEDFLEIEIDKNDASDLVKCILEKRYWSFWNKFGDVIHKHLLKFEHLSRVNEHWRIGRKILTNDLLTRLIAIVALHYENYDTLADKITDILSDSSPNFRP